MKSMSASAAQQPMLSEIYYDNSAQKARSSASPTWRKSPAKVINICSSAKNPQKPARNQHWNYWKATKKLQRLHACWVEPKSPNNRWRMRGRCWKDKYYPQHLVFSLFSFILE